MKKFEETMLNEAGKTGVNKAIDILVDKFIIPKLDKHLNSSQNIDILKKLFNEYLNKKYNKDKYINTIVFQNESKTIAELYIPLTIIQNGKRGKDMVINKNMANLFDEPNKLLIIDTAGTGKSTLVKFLSTFCVEKEWGIPFVIELRRIEKNQSILSYIIEDIQLSNENIKEADINELIKRGNFIFFLDGYDEILEESKTYITKEIRNFILFANNNNFVLTSREDDCLSEFSDFTKYHIKELSKNEAYELIKKYDGYGTISENLIDEIEKDENYKALEEFLGNPLMVSLLYLTYQYKGVLQYKKNIFYRQVFDALYDRHDSTKGVGVVHEKKSKLDIEDFRKVLCAMGFISIKIGKIEFNKDQFIDLINKSINIFSEINANAIDYLDDILHVVPLFKEEGVNYKWTHKSFAEYFAAVFICQERKEYANKVLNDILKAENNQRFYNMLDFCYDIDYKAVIDNLVYPILSSYVSSYEQAQNEEYNFDLWEIENFYKFVENVYFIKFNNAPLPKNRDFFDDYIEAANMLENEDLYPFSYLIYLSKNENIIMAVHKKPVYEIIKLLYRKKMDIFKETKVKEYSMKFFKNIEKMGVYNIFQDNQENLWIFENYDAILSCVYHKNVDFKGFILDVDKCKDKIKEIKKSNEQIPNDFFSLS